MYETSNVSILGNVLHDVTHSQGRGLAHAVQWGAASHILDIHRGLCLFRSLRGHVEGVVELGGRE